MIHLVQKNFSKLLSCVSILFLLQFFSNNALADTVVFSFTAGTAAATSSSNANVSAASCTAGIGNSFGTVSTPINGTSASSGYTGASGGDNIGNAAATTGNTTFNSSTSPYIVYTLTPTAGYYITITGISFGNRSTGTGPQAYTISTNVGGYGTGVASGTWSNNSTWALNTPTVTTVTGAPGTPIQVRVYGYGGSGSASSGTENWRMDDITFTITVTQASSVAISSTSPAASNVVQGTTNVLLESFPLTVTGASATLSGLSVTTAGTYSATDINNLKCWYSTSSTFSTGTATLLSTKTTGLGAGSQVFPSFTSQTLPVGTEYIYVTTDIAPTATVGDNINLASTSTSNFSLGSATVSGSTSASNVQTIIANATCSGVSSGTVTPTTNPSFCGSGSSALGLNGGFLTGTSGITYQWQSSSTGVGGSFSSISGATLSTYTTPTVTATTYYQCVTTCSVTSTSATSSEETVTINSIPTVNVTPAGGTNCSGTSGLNMTASGASTYTWLPATGLSATTGATVASTTTVSTTYTVTGTSSAGCTSSNTATVSYAISPTALTITPSSLLMCQNTATQSLTASGGNIPFTYSASNTTTVNIGASRTAETSVINVSGIPAGATITGVSVTLNASLSYMSDFIFNLKAPDNGVINLIDESAQSSAGSFTNTVFSSAGTTNITGGSPYTGTYAADLASLSTVAGYTTTATSWPPLYTTPNGNWTMVAYNSYSGSDNPSSLISWTITINYTAPLAPTWSPITNLYTTSAGSIAISSGTSYTTVYDDPLVSGVITYTATATNSGCPSSATATVTVNSIPSAISGSTSVCLGGSVSLRDVTSGGTWSASSANVTVDGSGNVTGVTGGTAMITYALSTGCINTIIVTVNPSVISGLSVVCVGSTITLSDAASGGTWQSGNTGVATIDISSGLVNGIAAGTTIITYTSSGCTATATISALSAPDPISGTNVVCQNSTTALTDPGGGTWSSSDLTHATVGLSTGIVTGVATGTATIIYTISCGTASSIVTINAIPSAISGASIVCLGTTVSMSDASSSGTWSSTNAGVASVDVSGNVTGNISGTATISYTIADGCATTNLVTVNPAVVMGTASVCVGSTTTLSDATGSGTWSSSAPSIGTVGSVSGVVSGISAGTTAISYTNGGCTSASIVTVNGLPSISFTPTTGNACSGGSGALITASGANTYTWAPGTALSATTGTSVTASPAVNSVYTATGTSIFGCVSSNTVSVTYNMTPGSLAISPAAYNTCQNAATQLFTATGGTVGPTTVSSGTISVSYSGGGSPAAAPIVVSGIPAGATITNASVTFTQTEASGAEDRDDVINLEAPNSHILNLVDGEGSTSSAGFVNTIVSSASGGAAFSSGSAPFTTGGPYAADAASTVGGTGYVSNVTAWSGLYGTPNGTWQLIGYDTYSSGLCKFTSWSLTLTYSYQSPVTWSPVTNLYTNSGGTSSYTGGPTNTIYDNPLITGIITYTATATNSGCTSTATTTVTVNTLPTTTASNSGAACAGGSVTLNSGATGAASYSWNGPSGYTSTLSSPLLSSVALSNGGTYTVTVTNAAGCSASSTTTVTVNAAPTTTPGNNSPACVGGTINFNANATSSSGTISYLWNGPDLSSATDATPSISSASLSDAIVYTVTVTTPGSGCTATGTTAVTVNAIPTTTPGNNSPACVGGTINFNANATSSSGTISYSWSGPELSSATVATPSIGSASLSDATVYTVTVTTPGSGCTATGTTAVTVNAIPTTTPGNNSPACVGGTINFNANATSSSGAISYSWSGPDLSSATDAAPSISSASLSDAIVYTVTVTTPGSGCTATGTTAVTVNAIPTTTPGNNSPACVGGAIDFNANAISSSGTLSYSWSGPDLSSATDATPSISSASLSDAIVYTVTVTTPGSGCTATGTTAVTVNAIPTTTPGNNSPACVGGMINFNANAVSSSGTLSYLWSGPDLSSATVATPSIGSASLSDATVYTVTVTTPGSGCTATGTTTATVNLAPTTAPGNNSPACVGGTINFNANATSSSGTLSYSWSGPDLSSATDATPSISSASLSDATVYTVTVTTLGSGCTATGTTTVTVNIAPTTAPGNNSPACVGGTINFNANATSGSGTLSYSWSGPDLSSATVATPSISSASLSDATIYTVTVTTPGSGCTATSTTVVTVNTIVVSVSNSGAACVGGTVSLNSGETGTATDVTYAWNGPSGYSSTATNPILSSVDRTFAGTYTVIASNGLSGCSVTGSTTVTVNPLPGSISGAANVCAGSTISLSDTPGGGTWSSNATGVATANSSGVITGVSAGTATIVYTLPTSCTASTVINVYPVPSVIHGAKTVCPGTMTNLSNDFTGGSWSISNANATVDVSGNVTGVTAGTAIVTYTSPGSCFATTLVTINPLPAAITGSNSVCLGLTVTLSDVTSGGSWSSSNTAIATVGATSRVVTGLTPGIDTIIYTLPTGCTSNYSITINAITPVSGNAPVCVGLTMALSDATGIGTWSSSITTHATVNTSTGVVTGVAAGTSSITYVVSATGCISIAAVTVNPLPASILGGNAVCLGSSISLSDMTTGGSWNTDVNASIDGSGNLTGTSAGTTMVTYMLSTGCMVTKAVNVSAMPSALSAPVICAGSTTAMTDAVSGGTWSSSNLSVATIGSGSGILTGVAGGTTRITYVTAPGSGCAVSAVVTINAIAPILGSTNICVGGVDSLSLSDGSGGGTWSTTSSAISINSAGVVMGLSVGTAIITYTIPSGCSRSVVIAINPPPLPISGTLTLCVGNSTALSDTGTGIWSSSYAVVAAVGSSTGIVTGGTTAGTATITYTAGPACISTAVVTVNPNLASILGASSVCMGATVTLSDASASGTWSSSNGNVTVDGSGDVTGVSTGTATISYISSTTGCFKTYPMTVKADPSPITGIGVLCVGGTTALSDTTSGALNWTSSNTAAATVTAGGSVTGMGTGTATIKFTTTFGCYITTVVTVNSATPTITGGGAICPGIPATLTDVSGAGAWSSSNASVVTVGSGSGIITGVIGGTATISYLPSGTSGCTATTVITVNPGSAITGPTSVCSNATITLNDATSGGTWSSSNTGIATTGITTGIVSGVSAGSVTISYITTGGCVVTSNIVVNTIPSAILGSRGLCLGGTVTLTDITGGGMWSSSNTSVATVGSGTGIVTGTGTAIATITYTAGGCYNTATVTVNGTPSPILGTLSSCPGSTTSLSDGTTGGTWSSTGVAASIGSTGIVTAASTGTATVSYTISTGCAITAIVTVNAGPSAILGNGPVCVGSTITLSDAVSGGTWTSSNGAIATIGSGTGIVTGVAGGISLITYSAGGSCFATTTVNVNAAIGAINGSSSVCAGATITLTDATTGGTWSSSNAAVGSVSTGGIVSGIAVGTANITYTVASGCTKAVAISVNAAPTAINGTLALCANAATTLTDGTGGGAWSISSALIATIGSATGLVTASGTYTGTATISYTAGGCAATHILTVNANPLPVQGSTSECVGVTITLSDGTAGGTWSALNTNVSLTGTATTTVSLTGAVAGASTITYTSATGCTATSSNTIYANPAPIGGSFAVCAGSTTTLTDATSGDLSWTSSNTTVASTSGYVVTGISAGTATITYKITTGSCIATQVITVNALPSVTAISGPASISHATPATLSDATSGGIWSSSNISVIALSGSTGSPVTATAVATSGGSVIGYKVTNSAGCSATVTKTITASPAPPSHDGSATGNITTLYVGATVNLLDDMASGTWSSSDDGIATTDGNGVVTGIRAGSVNITHVITNDQGDVTTNVMPVIVTAIPASVSILPNPNKGTFAVRGTIGSTGDEEVTLEVTDVLGQVIYKNKTTTEGGKLNQTILLNNTLANGMYMLGVYSGTEKVILHFVIEQ